MPADLYEILGVEPEADAQRIKRAFRRAAYECHPDHNPDDPKAEAKFKRVAAAFDVLSDPERRARYDQHGLEGVDEHFDFDRPVGEPGGQRAKRGWDQEVGDTGHRSQDRSERDEGDLGDSFRDVFGGRSPFDTSHFNDFSGFDEGKDGADEESADRGRAPFTGVDRDPWNRHRQVELSFETAVGGGDVVLSVAGEPVKIVVPPGVEDGDRLRVRGEGEPVGDGSGDSGDLILHVRVQRSELWTRRGLDLEMSLPVTVPEAVRGGEIEVPTPRGVVTVVLPANVEPGTRLRVEEHGVEREGKRGDLLLTVLIEMPDAMTDEVRDAVEALEEGYEGSVREELWRAYESGSR